MSAIRPFTSEAIDAAAVILRAGGLVAFPTETVYGLGAAALDSTAVARIYAAKGRPPTNPVIVHALDPEGLRDVVAAWPGLARELARRFWPGPLTLVLPKAASVPDVVTAGGPTVAVRVPAHPVAIALLRASGVPIAAPSANRSNQLSPTRAEHVATSLGDRVDLILDGGSCPGGLESTVLDLTVTPPRLLRPGLVSSAELESVIGPVEMGGESEGPLRSPGMLTRHYAPRAVLEVVSRDLASKRVGEWMEAGERVGWLSFTVGPDRVTMPSDAAGYAARLYAELHRLDEAGAHRVVVEQPPNGAEWMAIHDRLRRAATP